jgi:hypothetical protein
MRYGERRSYINDYLPIHSIYLRSEGSASFFNWIWARRREPSRNFTHQESLDCEYDPYVSQTEWLKP